MVALARSTVHAAQRDEVSDFAADVLNGLSATRKRVPPKYFYDAIGSQLFDRITEQPEYYPTRCEMRILQDNAGRHRQAHSGRRGLGRIRLRLEQEGAHSVGSRAGAGGLCAGRYLRRDGRAGSRRIAPRFPDLKVLPVTADFTQEFELPEAAQGGAGCGSVFSPARPSAISSRMRRPRSCAMPRKFSGPAPS